MLRKRLFYILAVLLTGLTGLTVPGEAAAPSQHLKFSLTRPQVRAISDITYAQYFDWPKSFLKMDILQPESKEKLPAVVFVTGGGFTASPKENYLQQRVHLAEHGYFVASVEYRVIPNGMFPDPVVDVKAALRYLRAHARDFNIDPNRMAVMGESAGGYLAAMVGTSNGYKAFDQGDNLDQSSDVQAAIDIYGLSDLSKVAADFSKEEQQRHASPAALQALFINGTSFSDKGGGSVQATPSTVKAANPVTYISPKTAPFLLLHGDKDQVVSPSQTELLYNALQEKGIPAQRYVVEGAGHADHYWAQPEVEQVILAFLDKNLKNKK